MGVMARNTRSHIPRAREWHLVPYGYLRAIGHRTPRFRADAWEVDWSKRNDGRVWARNPHSKMPRAREWHWAWFASITDSGIGWRPVRVKTGRYTGKGGYTQLTISALTEAQVELITRCGLWNKASGGKKISVAEHRLVAAEKYGGVPKGMFVRHLNGIKTDNRPENLVLGTPKENCSDHETARMDAMVWRERYEQAEAEIARLRAMLAERVG